MKKTKIIDGFPYIEYISENKEIKLENLSSEIFEFADKRRSVREFSTKPVPKEVIENIIKTASTAPSGAHKQPWTFCAVSNSELKSVIRKAAEEDNDKPWRIF